MVIRISQKSDNLLQINIYQEIVHCLGEKYRVSTKNIFYQVPQSGNKKSFLWTPCNTKDLSELSWNKHKYVTHACGSRTRVMEPVDKSHYSKHQDSDDSPALIGHKTVTVTILLAGTNISKVIKNTET